MTKYYKNLDFFTWLIYNTSMEKNEYVKKLISIFLIVVWMICVFCFSSQDGEESSHTSKGTVEKVISSVMDKTKVPENKKQEIIDWADPVVRKIAHYTEYMVGGILIINFITLLKFKENRAIFFSIFLGMLYAITDELHQLFVSGRTARVVDVFIDTLGVASGVVIFMIVYKIILKKRDKQIVKEGEC